MQTMSSPVTPSCGFTLHCSLHFGASPPTPRQPTKQAQPTSSAQARSWSQHAGPTQSWQGSAIIMSGMQSAGPVVSPVVSPLVSPVVVPPPLVSIAVVAALVDAAEDDPELVAPPLVVPPVDDPDEPSSPPLVLPEDPPVLVVPVAAEVTPPTSLKQAEIDASGQASATARRGARPRR